MGTLNLNHRLPKRVEERPVKRDHKDRPNIPILVGEAKLIKEKLDKGAKIVKKVIVFRASDEGPVVDVHAYIREENRGEDANVGEEITKHTKRLTCSYGDKVRLVEKVQEIRELAEEMGEERMEDVREVVDRVAGWPSARVSKVRGERLAEEKAMLSDKLAATEEKLRQSEEARANCPSRAELHEERCRRVTERSKPKQSYYRGADPAAGRCACPERRVEIGAGGAHPPAPDQKRRKRAS